MGVLTLRQRPAYSRGSEDMADPLSLTLAAVTLATALKDMVELAQAIGESFEKVSRNRREVRSLVSEIKTTLVRLKNFNDDRCDVLCDAVDTKVAILDLITDMRTIYDKCRDMYPPVPPNRIGRFKLDMKAWLNNNKIEEDIRNLRDRVNKCHLEFMMFAVMRIETRLIGTTRQTDDRPKQIKEVISTLRPSNDNLVTFMGSNARTLSKLPPEITADVISDAYLRIQINTIDYMLNQLSSNSYPVEDPSEDYLLPFSLCVAEIYYLDRNSRRQAVVLQSLEIQSYLCGDSPKSSIQAGAWDMVNLCIGLGTLKMYQEALPIIKWAVNIYRGLVKANPSVYMPHLVHSLDLLSSLSINVDNIDGALSAIEEAVELSRALQSSTTNTEMEFQLATCLTLLASISALKDDKEASLEAALEAVDIYKNAIIKNHDKTSCDVVVNLFSSPLASIFEGVPTYAIKNYGLALRQLSSTFEVNDHQDDACKAAREALDVTMFCSNNLKDNLPKSVVANMLYRISCDQFHNAISLESALSLSEQAVALFRCLYDEDVETHRISLYDALWQQAGIFGKLERWDEAMVCWRETAELAKDVIADDFRHAAALSRLSSCLREVNQYDEAVSIRKECVTVYTRHTAKTDHVARGYYNLGVELRLAGQLPESVKALQAALSQYRSLAFKDPEYTKHVGDTLNQLTRNFIRCKEFDQAFNEGHESLQLHERLIRNDSSVLTEYILALWLNCLVAQVADNEEKCIERAQYSVSCARTLTTLHPTEADLVFCQTVHSLATVLSRFGRVSEAGIAMQEALEWHEEHPSQEEKDVGQYMSCLITTSAIVYNQGNIQKATQYLQKSIDLGKPHSSHKPVFSALLSSMRCRVEALYLTGLYAEAVEASQECVDIARETEMEDIDNLIDSLQVAALALNYHGRNKEAVGYIQEALELSRGGDIVEIAKTRPSVLLLEGKSLTYLSKILADAGQEAQALIEGKAAVDNILGVKSKYATFPWSPYIESTYINALETYSMCLATSGDLMGSLDRLVQVRSYFEKQIDSRLGKSLGLACILEEEGIICCAAGRLDDGAAAVAKLHDLQNRLPIVHPELARNVQIALERQRASPSMIALVRKLNLKCNHEHQKSAS